MRKLLLILLLLPLTARSQSDSVYAKAYYIMSADSGYIFSTSCPHYTVIDSIETWFFIPRTVWGIPNLKGCWYLTSYDRTIYAQLGWSWPDTSFENNRTGNFPDNLDFVSLWIEGRRLYGATPTSYYYYPLDSLNRRIHWKYYSPAPIELEWFKVSSVKDTVHVAWRTISEHDAYQYKIYRNGSVIASVPAAGTTITPRNYLYLDTPGYGTFKYVLQLINLDGSKEDFNTGSITLNAPSTTPPPKPSCGFFAMSDFLTFGFPLTLVLIRRKYGTAERRR